MRKIAILFALISIGLFSGCKSAGHVAASNKTLLSVDFPADAPLRYKLVSERQIELNFDPSGKLSKGKDAGQVQKINETLEMTVSYKALETSPSGYTTVEANFENVTASRSSMSGRSDGGKDAVQLLNGKSVKFEVSPAGNLAKTEELTTLINDIVKQAFGGKGGGIKDAEMSSDFIAMQWFFWDPISTIPRPAKGVGINDTWNSTVLAPTPMPMNLARSAAYTLAAVEPNDGKVAVINAKYSASKDLTARTWPFPYSGSFQMRGVFGFLRGYQVLSLDGTGTFKYSVEKGRLESMNQQYKVQMKAEMPFALGDASTTPMPNMVIDQKLSAELLK